MVAVFTSEVQLYAQDQATAQPQDALDLSSWINASQLIFSKEPGREKRAMPTRLRRVPLGARSK